MLKEVPMTKMSDAEFIRRIREVGYVEACVESVRRDGKPFDESQTRREAANAAANLWHRHLDG